MPASLRWPLSAAFPLIVSLAAVGGEPTPPPVTPKITYPSATRSQSGDTYHGTWAADPYRWMEKHDGADTAKWLTDELALTRSHLDAITGHSAVVKTTRETIDIERRSAPRAVAGKFFYFKNDGLQEQSVLYRSDTLNGAAEVVIDANKLFPDGTRTISDYAVSSDGKHLAYGAHVFGSDVTEWKIRKLDDGKDYAETVTVETTRLSWSPHLTGFYYSKSGSIYFHLLGTDQTQDAVIFSESGWSCSGQVSTSGKYLVIAEGSGTDPNVRIVCREIAGATRTVKWLFPVANAAYDFICEKDGTFWFRTTLASPKGSIIKIALSDTSVYQQVVPEAADALESVRFVAGTLWASYIHDGHAVVKVFTLDGKFLYDVELPGMGTLLSVGSDGTDSGVLYAYSNYITPPTVFQFDTAADKEHRLSKVWFSPKPAFDLSDLTQEQVFYKSKDGTRVPMTLVHRKGLVKDGSNPTLLYGYGGFGVNITPAFRPVFLVWLRLGGTLAVPNLRGGAEYGQAWHDAGRLHNKQNVFDDFRAAAHWLIDEKYTTSGRLAASGVSNGGLLVSAAITQEPDLFAVAVPEMGVHDMIRYAQIGGSGWIFDYGDTKKADDFKILFGYSPLHNVRKGTKYPAVLVTTSDHDDRVDVAHSYKLAASLQYAQSGDRPVLLHVLKNAGHAGGSTTAKMIEFYADRYAFMLENLH